MANNVAEVNLRHLPTLEWWIINPQLQGEASNLQGEGLSSIKSLIMADYYSLACGLQLHDFIAKEKEKKPN